MIASTVAFIVGGSFLGQVLSEINWFMCAWTASLYRLQSASLASERESARVESPQPSVLEPDALSVPRPSWTPARSLSRRVAP
jgi:hypothetical protein